MGAIVGDAVGSGVVGAIVGDAVGSGVVGAIVGDAVGSGVVGAIVGDAVGSGVVGAIVGEAVGSRVGLSVIGPPGGFLGDLTATRGKLKTILEKRALGILILMFVIYANNFDESCFACCISGIQFCSPPPPQAQHA